MSLTLDLLEKLSSEYNHPDTKEVLFYTKLNDELLFNNNSGLKRLKVPLGVVDAEVTTKRNPYKRKSNNQRIKRSNPYSSFIGTDLSIGYSKFKPKSNKDLFKLDDIFRSMKYLIDNGTPRLAFKIISLRRVLSLLMEIPINLKDTRFNIIYWKGLIIIDYDWEHTRGEQNGATKYQYSGHRFEQVITGNSAPTEFYTLVKREQNIGNVQIPIHFTAEIDAAAEGEGLESYVELKTSTLAKLNKDSMNFKLKFLKALCQISFINGTECLFGYRSNNCQLKLIKNHTKEAMEEHLQRDPIYLNDKVEVTSTVLDQWFESVIEFIQNEDKQAMQNKQDKQPRLLKLSFVNGETLVESTLKFEEIHDEKIFEDTVPLWFQKYW